MARKVRPTAPAPWEATSGSLLPLSRDRVEALARKAMKVILDVSQDQRTPPGVRRRAQAIILEHGIGRPAGTIEVERQSTPEERARFSAFSDALSALIDDTRRREWDFDKREAHVAEVRAQRAAAPRAAAAVNDFSLPDDTRPVLADHPNKGLRIEPRPKPHRDPEQQPQAEPQRHPRQHPWFE